MPSKTKFLVGDVTIKLNWLDAGATIFDQSGEINQDCLQVFSNLELDGQLVKNYKNRAKLPQWKDKISASLKAVDKEPSEDANPAPSPNSSAAHMSASTTKKRGLARCGSLSEVMVPASMASASMGALSDGGVGNP